MKQRQNQLMVETTRPGAEETPITNNTDETLPNHWKWRNSRSNSCGIRGRRIITPQGTGSNQPSKVAADHEPESPVESGREEDQSWNKGEENQLENQLEVKDVGDLPKTTEQTAPSQEQARSSKRTRTSIVQYMLPKLCYPVNERKVLSIKQYKNTNFKLQNNE